MNSHDLDTYLLVGSGVLVLAILAVRVSVSAGLPSLLLYLGIGLAIGEAGAANAALSVVSVLALNDASLKSRLIAFRAAQAAKVRNSKLPELK